MLGRGEQPLGLQLCAHGQLRPARGRAGHLQVELSTTFREMYSENLQPVHCCEPRSVRGGVRQEVPGVPRLRLRRGQRGERRGLAGTLQPQVRQRLRERNTLAEDLRSISIVEIQLNDTNIRLHVYFKYIR